MLLKARLSVLNTGISKADRKISLNFPRKKGFLEVPPMKSVVPASFQSEFETDLRSIIESIAQYYPKFEAKEKQLIKEYFYFAESRHRGQKRYSGKPYFTHPIAAVKLLLPIRPDLETIGACLMHDLLEDTDTTAEEIEQYFGTPVLFLCEGVKKISKVQMKGAQRNTESLKKLFLAMAQDIRVIFVKLADRLHNLETLEFVPAHKRYRIAEESLRIYAAVASQLSLFYFKSKIEDRCFQYLYPEVFHQLNSQLDLMIHEDAQDLEEICTELEQALSAQKIDYLSVSFRYKNLYSIHQKMRWKGISHLRDVYDLFGMRVVVKTPEDCYRTLGALHHRWRSLPNRFKDYISVPKPNSYQSLHTVLTGLGHTQIPMEVQIKTETMHLNAEYGPAAHWVYKKKQGNAALGHHYLQNLEWWSQELNQSSTLPEGHFQHLLGTILSDQTYSFTPAGDLQLLPAGATPVDFAYHVHSDIGSHCVSCRVNNVMRPLHYRIQNGDIIEIITDQKAKPKAAWLDFVKLNSVRNKIRKTLKIKTQEPLKTASKTPTRKKVPIDPEAFSVVIGGEELLPYKIADCCQPKMPEPIVAYASRGKSFVVHAQSCPTVAKLNPDRLISAYFVRKRSFEVVATDRYGLMRDYSEVLGKNNIFIWDIHNERLPKKRIQWILTINAKSEEEFTSLLQDFRVLPGVLTIREIPLVSKRKKTLDKAPASKKTPKE